MAKKRGNPNNNGPSGAPATLRELATGIKPNAAKNGHANNPKSMLKLQHLQKLAVWAAGEGSSPSLAAFFGRRLAAIGESVGVPPDASVFSCQRCETILQPGNNCTVRIEKNKVKARRGHKKPRIPTQNNVVYTCHFCSHRNLKRGTPKGHMKDVYPPKSKSLPKTKPVKSMDKLPNDLGVGIDEICRTEIGAPILKGEVEVPATPAPKLLDSKRRKRNCSGAKKLPEPGSATSSVSAASSKRIISENSRNITPFKNPFYKL